MEIAIQEKDFDPPFLNITDDQIKMKTRTGEGHFRSYAGDGFIFWDNRYRFAADTVLQAQANSAVLELHITRRGIWKGIWDGIEELSLHSSQFNLSYTPYVNTTAYFRRDMNYHSCDIHFDVNYLHSLSTDFPVLNSFLTSVTKKNASSLCPQQHACTRSMTAACESILQSTFRQPARSLLVSIKVREILIAALEKVAVDLRKPLPAIRGRDKEHLIYAKQLIEGAGDLPVSLTELSRLVGLNECNLKRGFKLLFGASPYEYYVMLKMKSAKELLLETKAPVADIAYRLGYSQPSSFGHEFKKVMGVSPGEFRRQKK